MNDSREGWSEYWQQEGAGGEVFVDAQGKRHPALGEFWGSVFADLPVASRVIDIASGAGSIFGHLPADHGLSLSAADISPQALETLGERISGVSTVVCGADDIPLEDQSFELVVSQFGIEYAGVQAFSEAARLVAASGRLAALVHIRDGYIDSRNKAELNEARGVVENALIDGCLKLVEIAASGDLKQIQAAESEFVPSVRELEAAVKRCPTGVHAYLLSGFRELYEARQQYAKSDIEGWLEGMRGELDKAVMRLEHMRTAAMSADDITTIRSNFEAAGLKDIDVEEFHTPGNDKAVAWIVRAGRPG